MNEDEQEFWHVKVMAGNKHSFGFTGEGWVRGKSGTTKLVKPPTHEDLVARAREEAGERRRMESELIHSSFFDVTMSGTIKIINSNIEWELMIWEMINGRRASRLMRLRWRLRRSRRVLRERMGI